MKDVGWKEERYNEQREVNNKGKKMAFQTKESNE